MEIQVNFTNPENVNQGSVTDQIVLVVKDKSIFRSAKHGKVIPMNDESLLWSPVPT